MSFRGAPVGLARWGERPQRWRKRHRFRSRRAADFVLAKNKETRPPNSSTPHRLEFRHRLQRSIQLAGRSAGAEPQFRFGRSPMVSSKHPPDTTSSCEIQFRFKGLPFNVADWI